MNLSALQHSALLQSLGWAIANSLWQALSLWIVYQFIQFAYKNSSSRFKNNVSTLLLFSVFIWFALTFLHKYIVLQSGTTVNSFSQAGDEYLSLATTFNWSSIIEKVLSALPFLSIGYLFLLVTLSIRLINSYVHIYYIRKDGLIKPPAQWRLFAEKVSLHMGMSKKICLWFSENVDVPATVGFLKPFILIPLASINQLTPEQLEAVILHELSHIRRNDYLINLFISIIETILFFNPFVVLLSSIIKRERENCCDDFVIQYQYDRHSYASALLSLEQTRTKNIRLSQAATSGKKQLLGRIQRIMEVSNSNNINYGQKLLALLFITALISSIAWLSPEKKVKIIHTATPTTMEKKNLPLINHTEKKKNSPATPLSKITTIKTITNKIANALEKVSSKPGAKHTDELTGNMQWKSTDEDNSFTNTFTEPPKKEIKSKDGYYSFNKIQFLQLLP